jgi:hypothetical protein
MGFRRCYGKNEPPKLTYGHNIRTLVKDRPGLKEFLNKAFKRYHRLRIFLTTDCRVMWVRTLAKVLVHDGEDAQDRSVLRTST